MKNGSNKDMTKHPSRQELIAAATQKTGAQDQHLATCDECRALYHLFANYQVAGELALPNAPKEWINRAKDIYNSANPLQTLRRLVGRLSFDSWQVPQAVGVRSHELLADRRIRFEIGPLVLDVRAERQPAGWDFTAQVTGEVDDPSSMILRADRQTISPDPNGFYQWSSSRPPRLIRLEADDVSISLPELTWKQTPAN